MAEIKLIEWTGNPPTIFVSQIDSVMVGTSNVSYKQILRSIEFNGGKIIAQVDCLIDFRPTGSYDKYEATSTNTFIAESDTVYSQQDLIKTESLNFFSGVIFSETAYQYGALQNRLSKDGRPAPWPSKKETATQASIWAKEMIEDYLSQ